MSIDLSTKEFGFELYLLNAKLNAFSRQKIYKKDKNGIEWFHYSKDRHDFSYEKYTYVGRREARCYGEVDDNEFTEYFLKNDIGTIEVYDDDNNNLHYFNVPIWYSSEAEVIERISKLQLIDKEQDRK